MKKLPSISTRAEAYAVAEAIRTERSENRKQETYLEVQRLMAKSNPVISSNDLVSNLAKILPPHVAPKNIGRFDDLMWDYFFPVEFDFGVDPTFTSNTRKSEPFIVNQEGAFLLFGISRVYQDIGSSGLGAPLLVDIESNQTDKRFNDIQFPIQNIGDKGRPTLFETPMLIQKNTSVNITLTSWVESDLTTVGSGLHELMFFGLKVRNEETLKLLQTIFF
jgi:hypothetical protein